MESGKVEINDPDFYNTHTHTHTLTLLVGMRINSLSQMNIVSFNFISLPWRQKYLMRP